MRASPLLLTLLLALTSGCLAAVTPADEAANQFIDLIMARLGPHLQQSGMDPLPLDNLVIGFSKKVLLVTVHGSIGLTDGRLYGLSTMHRSGDCQLWTEGDTLHVDAKIGVKDLWGAFNGHAQFMGIGVNTKLSLAVASATVDASINARLGNDASTELKKFSISSISAITIRFSGLGLLDWIINPVTNVLVNTVRGVLVKIVEIPVRAMVQKLLNEMQLPMALRVKQP